MERPALIIPTSITISNATQEHIIALNPVTKNPDYHQKHDHITIELSDCNKQIRTTIGFIINGTMVRDGSMKEFILCTLKGQITNISDENLETLYQKSLGGRQYNTNMGYDSMRQELATNISETYKERAINGKGLSPDCIKILTNLFGVENYYIEMPIGDRGDMVEHEQTGEC